MASSEKVCIIGSGNWGSTISRIVGENVQKFEEFDKDVTMWVMEEEIEGRKLTEIINSEHENVKYLPGFKLPHNVRAEPELIKTVQDATVLIFVLPHQFVRGVCQKLHNSVQANHCKAVSLVKGVDAGKGGFQLISDIIEDELNGIDVSVMMGANIASEVAEGHFCESTLGYHKREHGELFYKLFHTPHFRINMVHDVAGVEICGALKNVVALGAGFVDGLNYGSNTKAAIIRIGLMEMKKFAHFFYNGVREETFLESCGVADLITTCMGGRNRKVAEAMVKTGQSISELERTMLNGQMLQGTTTAQEIFELLDSRGMKQEFPLFTTVYKIAFENMPACRIVQDV